MNPPEVFVDVSSIGCESPVKHNIFPRTEGLSRILMHNVCSECHRKFNPDLRYCPYCGCQARAPKTRFWNYEDKTLVGHEDPVNDHERKAYRQNGFLLLVAVILIIPVMLIGIEEFIGLDLEDMDLSLLGLFTYVILAFVLIAYGTYCAFASKRPGAQLLAAFLIWANTFFLHPVAFAIFGLTFGLIWVIGSSKSDSWAKPDATYLGLMTVVGIVAIIWGYLWFFNQHYAFLELSLI